MPMCFGSRLKLFITVSCVCRPRAALLPLARPGDAAHGPPLSARSTVGRTFGVTSLDQITASRQPSWLRSCGLSCHPDCCVMGPTLPREGSKARQSRRLGSASDPGNHWAAIPAALLGLECGDKPRVHVLDGATGRPRSAQAGARAGQSTGGSSWPNSSAASASSLVAYTAPAACSAGPYTV